MGTEQDSQIFQRLTDIPLQFAYLASELSDRLVAIEDRLNALPSKTEVSIWKRHSVPQVWLRFGRGAKDRWAIYYAEADPGFVPVGKAPPGSPLAELPLRQKMHASRFLGELLNELVSAQTQSIDELTSSLAQLAQVEAALGIKKEGK